MTVSERKTKAYKIALTIAKSTESTRWFYLVIILPKRATTEKAGARARRRLLLLLLLAKCTKPCARLWLLLALTKRTKDTRASTGTSGIGLTSRVLSECPKSTCVGGRLGGIICTERATAKHRIRSRLRRLTEQTSGSAGASGGGGLSGESGRLSKSTCCFTALLIVLGTQFLFEV
jgi:hypothetical protein